MNFLIIFGILGGLALFLYGMFILNGGLQKIAGDKIRLLLEKMTNKPLKGVASGTAATALIQSSSIMTVTLIGLINVGLIKLPQAIAVIMGANIGTTITAQIISFKITAIALPLITIGALCFFIAKKGKYKYMGQIILAFGIIFLGMNIMSSSASPLQDSAFFLNLMANMGKIPLLGVLVGAMFTGIIQSSSATTGMVIALGTQNLISLKAAIAIIIGANIGTCVTVLIVSIGTSLPAKRAAAAHIIFNIVGAIIFIPIIGLFAKLIVFTSSNLVRQIANAHTIFNVLTALVLIPTIPMLTFLITKKLLPGKEIKIDGGIKFLDNRILATPSLAVLQASKELKRMGLITLEMLKQSKQAYIEKDKQLIAVVKRKEEVVDEIWAALNHYLVKLSEKSLNNKDLKKLTIINHSLNDIERVGDHVNNIVEIAEEKIKNKLNFSEEANKELNLMFEVVIKGYEKALELLDKPNKKIGRIILKLENMVDRYEEKFEENHMKRLKNRICEPRAGILFVDTLRNLERISDHSNNIASCIMIGF